MAKQQQTQQQAGGWMAALISVAALLLLGVAARYWYLSHQHPPEPANAPVLSSAGVVPTMPRTAAASDSYTPAGPLPVAKHLYPAVAEAHGDLAAALREAKSSHKRILLDFGGDWCPDCQVLDVYFHQGENAQLLADNFVKVNVNIGQMDANLDVATKYGVPIAKGVPALAVLDENGRLLYSQKTGEFEAMRRMQVSSVTDFLNQWKPQRG